MGLHAKNLAVTALGGADAIAALGPGGVDKVAALADAMVKAGDISARGAAAVLGASS